MILLSLLGLAFMLISMVFMMLSYMFSKKKYLTPFECGFDPLGVSRLPFSSRFFLIAVYKF